MTLYAYRIASNGKNRNDIYQDFHARTSRIDYVNDREFIIYVSDRNYLVNIFNREEEDGSGLCQNYSLIETLQVLEYWIALHKVESYRKEQSVRAKTLKELEERISNRRSEFIPPRYIAIAYKDAFELMRYYTQGNAYFIEEGDLI